MVRVWTKTAVSASAYPYLWGGSTIKAPHGSEHLLQIAGPGLCCDDTLELFTIEEGTEEWGSFNL